MSANTTDHFQITERGTPQTYRVYMRFPVEVTECWANLCAGKRIDHDVNASVDSFLCEVLYKTIRNAFVADGAAMEDEGSPSGLKPVKGCLRTDKLSRMEHIEAMSAQANNLAQLAKKDGGIKVSGSHIITNRIPSAIAEKAMHMIIEASSMLLSAEEDDGVDSCRVRMSALYHIDRERT